LTFLTTISFSRSTLLRGVHSLVMFHLNEVSTIFIYFRGFYQVKMVVFSLTWLVAPELPSP